MMHWLCSTCYFSKIKKEGGCHAYSRVWQCGSLGRGRAAWPSASQVFSRHGQIVETINYRHVCGETCVVLTYMTVQLASFFLYIYLRLTPADQTGAIYFADTTQVDIYLAE